MKLPFFRKSTTIPQAKVLYPDLDLGQMIKWSYAKQLDEYARNPFVAHAIDIRAGGVAGLDPVVYNSKGEIVENHPLLQFFKHPNPRQSWRDIVYQLQTDLALNGNAYLYMIKTVKGISEAYVIHPDKVVPMPSTDALNPVQYWQVNLGDRMQQIKPGTDDAEVYLAHLHTTPDKGGILGVSPLGTVGMSVVQQGMSREWNVAMLKNGAKPSIVISAPTPVPEESARKILDGFNKHHSGATNAGRATLLTNGMTIDTAGFDAKEMDWVQSMAITGREIAVGLKVPSELLGDSSNKTYSNEEVALRYLATHCIMPLADQMYEELTRAFVGSHPDLDHIGYDPEQVEGLKGDDSARMSAIESITYLTVNEKRAIFGYEPVEDGDTVMVPMGNVPLAEQLDPVMDTEVPDIDEV